jgi:dienelactone hydrolase
MKKLIVVCCFLSTWMVFASLIAQADGPADNNPATVRRVPKLGVEVPEEKAEQLKVGLAELEKSLAAIHETKDARRIALAPDVAIFHKAVHDALTYQEFFTPEEIDAGFKLLDAGRERAAQLLEGKAPWTDATGLVVRGYVSKIDGSVQPYGLVVPPSYTHKTASRYRLDIWLHGRGEVLSELNFIRGVTSNAGVFQPADTIVLHPYGRYCNAFKFAGEVDVYEGLAHVSQQYRVDEDRVAIRGFSMGGAGCWQFAVHDPSRWFAANPGAGFSETPEFLKIFQKETLKPEPWEERLWNWYDCPPYCENLKHVPTIVYSGEDDTQIQAAQRMERELAHNEMAMRHIIAPKTGHTFTPEAKKEIELGMSQIAIAGRQTVPLEIAFTTYTLRYNRCAWLTIEGLGEHWRKARVAAKLSEAPRVVASGRATHRLRLDVTNITDLRCEIPSGGWPLSLDIPVEVSIVDGDRDNLDVQTVVVPPAETDRSWRLSLHRDGNRWVEGSRPKHGLRKQPGLHGPIDDAFMDSFLFVRPSGTCAHPQVEAWVHSEMDRAIEHWRRHFRGVVRIKNDTDVTDDNMKSSHVVLWGDPKSNHLLGKIADQLPIKWSAEQVQVGDKSFDASNHAAIAIYPNPLSPSKYVVLNSGFTFRDYDYSNNARQTPKLPDWVILDLSVPADSRWPGKIVAADFFDEQWTYGK